MVHLGFEVLILMRRRHAITNGKVRWRRDYYDNQRLRAQMI
jgi:hypothetical protein